MRVRVYEPAPPRRPGTKVPVEVASEPKVGPRDRFFEVRPTRDGRHRLDIAGPLGLRWAEPLCRGLARAGIAVRRGFALSVSEGLWHATFELEAGEDGADPVLLDYFELSSQGARRGFSERVILSSYEVAESSRHEGSLLLEVRGPDRLGFLGGLLERLAFLGLAAVEMRIWTDAEGVHDRFYVKQREGSRPTRRAAKLLAEALDGRMLR